MSKQKKLTEREKAICQRVKSTRESLEPRVTQEDVAGFLGVSKSDYGHYERMAQPFTVEQLFILSRILGKPVTYFLGLDTGLREDEADLVEAYRQIDNPLIKEFILHNAQAAAQSAQKVATSTT